MEDNYQIIDDTPWKNVYWFARALINSDQYGAIGKNDKLMNELIKIYNSLDSENLSNLEKYEIGKKQVLETIISSYRQGTKVSNLVENFCDYLDVELQSWEDIVIFMTSIKHILLPINTAMAFVPSDDKKFCCVKAKEILDSRGEKSVDQVISLWDELGVKGCLSVEREYVVLEFLNLCSNLSSIPFERNEIEEKILLTTFVQEFERRLGQKRKGRAGTSLEDVITFLFDYYKFSSHPKPDHFQTDIEVDKWFKCRDGWSIGISCKRTLRERWKQVSSADSNALSRYQIKEIWHITTYDKDLSDEKLTMLGQQRQIFYLADTSERYKSASIHKGMKEYVRPLSQLINDIRNEQGL
ncbi:hypothetical protein MmiHf6_08840 [Methanimicrococcus hongohii]|uniref:Restriction endonuclease type II EcoRII C-terminal domain-containing protein n=1 Tax=Methanimicrococcus hongohii TaxID=3028295 RepID=A0AA96V095_9EURY|nr:hypothetical protein [Methanimicrococcus sp. Hf6]WNY23575.1 hypothetical protein MmiHf6_08840 [Methanimicrococcus sp. Hf6]